MQIYLRGDRFLLEMVATTEREGAGGRQDADKRGTIGNYWRCVEHERRGLHSLSLVSRSVHLGIQVDISIIIYAYIYYILLIYFCRI